MEAKKRGTFKIDRNITPKDNICNLLKQVYPVEVTISKMNPQQFTHEGWDSRENKSENTLLKNVDVFPMNKYKMRGNNWRMGENATPQDCFARIGFGLKSNAKHCNRRGRDGYVARWSVPIKNEKVSIGKVKSIFEEMQEISKEVDEYSVKREEAEKIRDEMRQAKHKYVEEVNILAGKHPNMQISSQGYNDKMPSYFQISVGTITKAQAIAIGKAVNQIMADPTMQEPEIKDNGNG